jgi:hypothetical protein
MCAYHAVMEFPPVRPGDDVRLSASTFLTYQSCPASAIAKLDGFYGPDSLPAFKGGLAHRIFARHLKSGPILDTELAQVCREEIGGSTLNYKLGSLGMRPSSLGRVIDEVGALYQRFRNFPTDGFRGAEVELEVEPVDGVVLFGTVDAVFDHAGGVKLIDWKTNELGRAANQLGFYTLLWVLKHDELPACVEAVSVGSGERFTTTPDAETVTRTAHEVAGVVDGIRAVWAGEMVPERRGGPWCRYCGILDDCDEGRAAVELFD